MNWQLFHTFFSQRPRACLRFACIFILCGVLVTGIYQAENTGLTADEYAHLGAIESYRHGLGLNPEHPLGQKIIATIWYSLLFSDITPTEVTGASESQYLRGVLILQQAQQSSRQVIFWMRMVFVVTHMLIFVWLWLLIEKGWIHSTFGLIFSILFALSPSIFAHAPLLAFDVAGASSLFMFSLTLGLSMLHFNAWKYTPNRVLALVYGLLFWTLNTKFSNGIVLVPLALWLGSMAWQLYLHPKLRSKHIIIHFAWLVVLLIVQWSMYAWAFRQAPELSFQQSPTALRFDQNSFGEVGGLWYIAWNALEPLLHYCNGAIQTINRTESVQAPFLFGQFRQMSLLHFSSHIFWVKENTAFVIATVAAGIFGFFQMLKHAPKLCSEVIFSRQFFAWIVASVSPVLYAVISAQRFLVIGYRHAYPLLIFIIALVAWAGHVAIMRHPRYGRFFVGACGIAMVGVSVLAQPAGISYLNNFVLSPRQDIVNDSTFNWGQQHRQAFAFVATQPLPSRVLFAGFPHSVFPDIQCQIELYSSACSQIWFEYADMSRPLNWSEFDYFIVDSHEYQNIVSGSRGEFAQQQLVDLQQFPLVFNSQEVVWVYQLPGN